jgi:hypothetical protein
MYYRRFAGKARPILRDRDYNSARQILREAATLSLLPEDEERMEALLREIVAYESDASELARERSVALAEYVDIPAAVCPGACARRWSDRADGELELRSASRPLATLKTG